LNCDEIRGISSSCDSVSIIGIAAKENLTLIGKNVDLAAAQNTSQGQLNTQGKSSGFGVGITVNPLAAYKDAYKSIIESLTSFQWISEF
jgi:filamentous hemagglutinin